MAIAIPIPMKSQRNKCLPRGRSYSVKESEIAYYSGNDDTDSDSDPDTDEKPEK